VSRHRPGLDGDGSGDPRVVIRAVYPAVATGEDAAGENVPTWDADTGAARLTPRMRGFRPVPLSVALGPDGRAPAGGAVIRVRSIRT
jgi:hypothetical protein